MRKLDMFGQTAIRCIDHVVVTSSVMEAAHALQKDTAHIYNEQ
jgi:hypothetical protein